MKRKCNVCDQYNGSCNQYITNYGEDIIICPNCLAWSNDRLAIAARQAHKQGRLLQPGKEQKGK